MVAKRLLEPASEYCEEEQKMEKSTVYFTDFRCPVGTSQLDKLKKLCVAAGIKNIDMDGMLGSLAIRLICVRTMRKR